MRKDIYGIGIDFGTTNSIAAVYNTKVSRETEALTSDGKLPHPSIVWYQADGTITVGAEAKKNMMGFSNVEGHRFISSIKRSLGKNQLFSLFGRKVPASDVAAEIFRYLRENAKTKINYALDEAVVTIPIDFNGQARRELRRAADKAGVYIKTFVHEPFAAVVRYCHHNKKGIEIDNLKDQIILVFDWGGGTLDITVVQVIDKELIELSIAGMNRAGDDFDKQLVKYAKDSLIEKLSASPKDLDFLPSDEDQFRAECERTKISLSEVESEMIQVADACKYRGQSQSLKQPISRKDLNGLIDKDVKMALAKVDEALEQANLSARDVDLALLIGGSSKIPDVHNQLREKFGYRTEVVKNANTIIAEGAAIVDGLGIQPTFARSICVELSDGTLYDIFKAGDIASPSVCRKSVNFYCTDNREGEAKLIIKERTGQVGTTRRFFREVLSIPVSSALPKRYQPLERVTTEFTLDQDMVLRVSGRGATQKRVASCEIHHIGIGRLLAEFSLPPNRACDVVLGF